MLSLARNGFTASRVMAALHAPNRLEEFRYELLGPGNANKGPLGHVLAGSVSYNALAVIKRTARFTIRDVDDINFLADRVKVYYRVWVPPGRILGRDYYFLAPNQVTEEVRQESPTDSGWAEFPLGVFLLTTPPRRTDGTGMVIREVEAYDLGQILQTDAYLTRHSVPAGTNYVDAVKDVLASCGFTLTNIVATDKTLPAPRDWEPGTPKATIVQDLLASINYWGLWFDADGVPTSAPYVAPGQRGSEYTYKDDTLSVMLPEMEQGLDLFGVPNVWVVYMSEADRAYAVATYTNASLDSPTSTVNRGYSVVKRWQVDVPDQSTLQAIAERQANEDSQVYESVTWGSLIMPQHAHEDVYTLAYSALPGLNGQYAELEWGFDLKPGATMTHRARRIVKV